ncbi:MAG: glycosyltransferase [Dissulfurispiraceae bacterium]|jgi:glycosyltransferase involved in cell wall biosynthesis
MTRVLSEIKLTAVILPVFNESRVIESTVQAVKTFAFKNPDYYFLFVDDGSSDDTAEIIRAAIGGQSQPNIAFLHYEQNMGKGHAIKSGFKKVKADALCFIDSDLAYSLDHLNIIKKQLQSSDVVIGSRKISSVRENSHHLTRRNMRTCFNKLSNVILKLPFRDTQAGLKGLRFDAAQKILERSDIKGFGFDVELLYLARKFGLSITEIDAKESELHSYKQDKLKLLKDSIIMFFNLFFIRWQDFLGKYD